MAFRFNTPRLNRKNVIRITILLTLWLFGLIAGVLAASYISCDNRALLYSAICSQPAWIVIFIIRSLPFVLCVVAFYYSRFSVQCVLITLDSVGRAFCGYLIFLCYGSGAWLIRFGFLFSSAASSVLLWWFNLKYYLVAVTNIRKDILILAILLTTFTLVDHLLVSPFIKHLLMNI